MTKMMYLKTYWYLNETEAKILSLKDNGYTNTKIGETLDISKERVRQICNMARSKIEKYGEIKLPFYKALSIENLDIYESVMNTLISAKLFLISDVFTMYKNGKLKTVKGLGEAGISEILKELNKRGLVLYREGDNSYSPNDLSEIECRLHLLSLDGISAKDIRSQIFKNRMSMLNINKMISDADSKCRISATKGSIEELVLPKRIEDHIIYSLRIQNTDELVSIINNNGLLYEEFSYNDMMIIFKSLDRYGYKYFR